MSREWRIGDVAAVMCSDGEWRQATCEQHANWPAQLVWRFPDRVYRTVADSAARLLVVIDPQEVCGAVDVDTDDHSQSLHMMLTCAAQYLESDRKPIWAEALRSIAEQVDRTPPEPETRKVVLELDGRHAFLSEFLRFVATQADSFNAELASDLADQIDGQSA